MDSIRLPTWGRFALVIGVIMLAAGAALVGYRWYMRPTTLSIAVGSLDGEAGQGDVGDCEPTYIDVRAGPASRR